MANMKKAAAPSVEPGPSVGEGLIEAFTELAAHLRGEVEVESYEFVRPEALTPARIRTISESVGLRKLSRR